MLCLVGNSYMLCVTRNDLYERASWDGAEGRSRQIALDRISGSAAYLSPLLILVLTACYIRQLGFLKRS